MFQQARSSRVRLLCAHIFCFIFVFGTQAFGQITPNIRAIDRAVSTNIDQALTRHPVELAIEQSSGSVIALDFDESSSYLLTLHEDGQIISWDLETGRPLTRFERLSDQVFALKFWAEMHLFLSRAMVWFPYGIKGLVFQVTRTTRGSQVFKLFPYLLIDAMSVF